MASGEFHTLRDRLRESRRQTRTESRALFLARERARQLEEQRASLERALDPQDEAGLAERARLDELQRATEQRIAELMETARTATVRLDADAQRFADFSDPRRHVEQLDDALPFLLFPLRLETRFKELSIDGGLRHQLWVRAYPDDCAIDTFEDTPTEAETRNAQRYWAQLWRADGDEALRRAAWRNLVASHGSGRALWVVENYRPLNPSDAPPLDGRRVVLAIVTETPLNAEEARAAAEFWEATWRAREDALALAAAHDALIEAVGDERAASIIADYRPFNLDDPPPEGSTRGSATVVVATLQFEPSADLELRRDAWARAPHVRVLPDRLVLIAYRGDTVELEELGNPIPSELAVGPDPQAPEGDQIRQDGEEIFVNDEMRWMVDFDEAVRVGMGFRIDLTPTQHRDGFDQVIVLGVRLSSDEDDGQRSLEELLRNHLNGQAGLSLLRQGTPTNNTDDGPAAYSNTENADATYPLASDSAPLFEPTTDPFARSDGQWFAELLGIDPGLIQRVPGADQTELAEAQAMNTALFPATIGYLLDTMLEPVFNDADVDFVRRFFIRWVSGRGLPSALRIGAQPYGIVPATVYSRLSWAGRGEGLTPVAVGHLPRVRKLHEVLMRAHGVWGSLSDEVARVGGTGDPHQTLLEALGLHATSAEFDQRYAKSLTEVINELNLQGLLASLAQRIALLLAGTEVLQDHGYDIQAQGRPDLLDRYFFDTPHPVDADNLVQTPPLSETEGLAASTTDGRNYVQWLADAARTSVEALRQQADFDATPTTLLYRMLRHAAMLAYYDTSVRLTSSTAAPASTSELRREAPVIHVAGNGKASESRFRLLYDSSEAVGGSASVTVADFITSRLTTADADAALEDQISAMERLRELPAARLERLLVEHLDVCGYRLDAWLQGLVHQRLESLRYAPDRENARPGIYLGAFGLLEEVRPSAAARQAVTLDDERLKEVFQPDDEAPLMRDPANAGYIHAPSPNQAVTAAVLRSGYQHAATPEAPGVFAVGLTSERVRRAMVIIQGVRSGQSLGALLGYQFERGLHDRYGEAEVDEFIFNLRKAFPLVADRMRDTARPVPDDASSTDEAIEAIEARNVLDGAALAEHINESHEATYPFGKSWLPPATPAQADAINQEVQRLLDTQDAVADLGMAEGIHQLTQGNYDRAAASVEAFASGEMPPLPEVVRTPRSGIGLTHRVGLHLTPGLPPTASPNSLDPTSRASAEPALNDWLAKLLPEPDQIGVRVRFSDGTGASGEAIVTQADLGLQPIDLLYVLHAADEQDQDSLDDAIVRHVAAGLRPDAQIQIAYTEAVGPLRSFFEVSALIDELRELLLGARPLGATDVILPNEADATIRPLPEYDPARLTHIRAPLVGAGSPPERLRALVNELTPLLDDVVANRDDLVNNIDDRLERFVEATAELNHLSIPSTGFGAEMAWKRERYSVLLSKVEDLLARWQQRIDTFDILLAEYDALPPAVTDEERLKRLAEIEAQVTVVLAALEPPPTPAAYRAAVLDRRNEFTTKRDAFAALLGTTTPQLAALFADVRTTASDLETFDFVRLELDDDADEIVRYSADLRSRAAAIAADVDQRVLALNSHLAEYGAATSARERETSFSAAAHALLGEDFLVVPEFRLSTAHATEMGKAIGASSSLLGHLTSTLDVDFPVDDWLYGVARVREPMRRWEAATMLGEALTGADFELQPIQLPHRDGDSWLALEYPPDLALEDDKLLYTAHYATPFDGAAAQCGLLVDEWTEVIPAREETTGIAFHYDRPNAEPPQVMLLATSPQITGSWRWNDLADTVRETFELAKRRAVEPDHLASTEYARFLPATVTASTFHPITIAMDYAVANEVFSVIDTGDFDG
jgi:hypothetical protein